MQTDKLAKYRSRNVPRYTSYPTAPHLSDAVNADHYRAWLAELDPEKPLSLYLHVPFCRMLCWYCGCNMKLATRDDPIAEYAANLMLEIELVTRLLPARMKISHLHWGGGTPTALAPADLARIMELIRDRFDFEPDAEIAIEGDPRCLSDEMMETVGELGFNRASFGVQEFDLAVQKAINRMQPPLVVSRAVDGLRNAGVERINFDLIYGLPYQTVETLEKTIEICARMRPDRVALFGYAHVPWMAKRQRMIPESALPKASERMLQADAAARLLVKKGFRRIGMDHFARPDDPLVHAHDTRRLHRNFQGYTTDQAETLLPFGATSIGRTPHGFVQNLRETGAWAKSVQRGKLPVARGHEFDVDDAMRSDVIEQIMCYGSVDLGEVLHRYKAAPSTFDHERSTLKGLESDGILRFIGNTLVMDEAARPLMRVVASVFDDYLVGGRARHSVAV